MKRMAMAVAVAVVATAGCAVEAPELEPEPEPEIDVVDKRSANALTENSIAVFAEELNRMTSAAIGPGPDLAFVGSTPYGRRMLRYVAHCAFPKGALVPYIDVNGQQQVMPDGLLVIDGVPTAPGMGLAPAWFARGLFPIEKRWLMACVLSHINTKVKLVDISLRGNHAGLATTATEVAKFPFLEGAFWGEFIDPAVGGDAAGHTRQYACYGPVLATKCGNPAAALGRGCAVGVDCHFEVVGPCESTGLPPATPVACAQRLGDSYATCYSQAIVGAPGPGVRVYGPGVVTSYLQELSCD